MMRALKKSHHFSPFSRLLFNVGYESLQYFARYCSVMELVGAHCGER